MDRASTRQILITFLPPGLLLIALWILMFWLKRDIAQFLRDPMDTAGLFPLVGFVSNIGIMLWCGAASIALFAGLIIRRIYPSDASGFLISSAFISFYLAFDDLFQIHEDLASYYFGVSELYVYMILGIAILMCLSRYWRVILSTHFGIILSAFVLLAISVAVDTFFEQWLRGFGQTRILIEDGAKLLGIAAWCSYYARTSYDFLVEIAARADQVGAGAKDELVRSRVLGGKVRLTESARGVNEPAS